LSRQAFVDSELCSKPGARLLHDGVLPVEINSEVVQQQVDAESRQAPALVRTFVARLQRLENFQRGFAVDLKKSLGQLDAIDPAVTLDLAFVGIELNAPHSPIIKQRRHRFVQSRT